MLGSIHENRTPRRCPYPPGLLAEIEAAAAEEHRPARELVGEAVERYLSERRWFRRDEVHAKIARRQDPSTSISCAISG
jgi:metal-responsive CopG/Arc/MetJ family transcriptional regulator